MLLTKALSSPSAGISGCVKSGVLVFNEHVLDFDGHQQSVIGSPEQDWLPLKFIQKSSDTSRKCILVAFEDEPTCTCRIMVFNTTFKYILVISWRSVLLVEETRVP